ncbi:integrase [Deltaproteobacteria bacterium]|nr:integrase [Deltaproteobacteria bacterium]
MKNPNHPKQGSKILVHPIQNVKDIQSIKTYLSDNPRDLLLFTLGINNGIRTGDLLKLRVSDVKDLKSGDSIQITESKTNKPNVLSINKEVHKTLRHFLATQNLTDDDYLFKSRNSDHALTVMAVNRLVKSWCKAINLNGNYGAHTLRKTFGYIQRTKFGVGFEVLCRRFNHSSPAITMRYLGITDKEVYSILQNEI